VIYYYTKENGEYIFHVQDLKTKQKCSYSMGRRVGLIYDKQAVVLLKHGNIEFVRKYFDDILVLYQSRNFGDISDDLKFVSSNKVDPSELTHIINNNNKLKSLRTEEWDFC